MGTKSRWVVSLLAVSLGCVACASGRRGPVPGPAPFDRTVAEREVYTAVLRDLYMRSGVEQLVIDPELPAIGPEGTTLVAERLPELRRDTRADLASRTTPARVPADLAPGVPVRWFTDADWKALPIPAEQAGPADMDARWSEFHRRFPHSAGLITFSQIGFSRDGTEAVLNAGSWSASLGGAGRVVLLRKEAGVWRVKKSGITVVS